MHHHIILLVRDYPTVLLPEPLVDARKRQAFVQTVREYDQLGHGIWRRLYDQSP